MKNALLASCLAAVAASCADRTKDSAGPQFGPDAGGTFVFLSFSLPHLGLDAASLQRLGFSPAGVEDMESTYERKTKVERWGDASLSVAMEKGRAEQISLRSALLAREAGGGLLESAGCRAIGGGHFECRDDEGRPFIAMACRGELVLWRLSSWSADTYCRVRVDLDAAAGGGAPPAPAAVREPPAGYVDGVYLAAFARAHELWLADGRIMPGDKRLQNHLVKFSRTENEVRVQLVPKISGKDEETVGGRNQMGREVLYRLRADDLSLIERTFAQ